MLKCLIYTEGLKTCKQDLMRIAHIFQKNYNDEILEKNLSLLLQSRTYEY